MATTLEEKVQHGGRISEDGKPLAMHNFAIVDEVDNILIDEARTPLIISGAPEQAADLYERFAKLAPMMEPGKKPEGMDPRAKKEFLADYDYEFDEKHKTVSVTEQGVAKAEKFLGIDHLYRAENGIAGQPPAPGAEGRVALQEGRRLRRHRRRGQDHRRVHRPHPGRPPLVGGPAPGRRGQGGRARPRGEPDARDGHAAELLPHVRQARGHVGHGPDRGHRVHEDLQGRRGGDPHEPPDGPQGSERPDLQDPARASGARSRARSRRATTRASPCSSARSPSRSPSCCPPACASSACRTRCSTPSRSSPSARARRSPRPAAPARSRSPPTWPAAAWTSSSAATRSTSRRSSSPSSACSPGDPDYDERFADILPKIEERVEADRADRRGGRRPVTSSAPSATSRAGSTTSCAAAPAARATPASRASSSPPRTTSCACSPATGSTRSWTASARRATTARKSRSRRRCSRSRSRAPSARSRSRTTSSASASSSTTTS